MRTVGRLLRMLRLAAGLSVEAAALEIELAPTRLRALESGRGELSYLEGLLSAKAYLLCPTCFAKHVRAAVARGAGDMAGGDARAPAGVSEPHHAPLSTNEPSALNDALSSALLDTRTHGSDEASPWLDRPVIQGLETRPSGEEE